MTTVTKTSVLPENVTGEPYPQMRNYHETERAVQKRDENRKDASLYQIGDGRAPVTSREDKALARWVEIDQRRYDARIAGKPFQFTPAERALKTRLLKSGLIVSKTQWKLPARSRRRLDEATHIGMAKIFAANGDAGAIQVLEAHQLEQDRKKWQKRERALRKLPADTLIEAAKDVVPVTKLVAAAKDVMAAQGKQFTLDKLWRDFTEAFDAATPEKQQIFCTGKPAMLEAYLKSRGASVDNAEPR